MDYHARFKGQCSLCGEAINVGDAISWTRTKTAPRATYHKRCTPQDAPTPAPTDDSPEAATEAERELKAQLKAEAEQEAEEEEQEQEQPEQQEQPEPDQEELLARLEAALAKYRKPEPKAEPKVPELDLAKVQAIVKEALESLPGKGGVTTVRIEKRDCPPITLTNVHKMFSHLLALAAQGDHVYLHGPHGSGKSSAAKQVADVLERPYAYISLTPQTPESRLVGYKDAHGVYQRTPFRDIYEHGGIFCIDELDNGAPSLETSLNGALENGHMAFPDGIIPRHESFVMIGTGNTNGCGPNPLHPERRPFDVAFARRFTFLAWGYDTDLEQTIALGVNPDSQAIIEWVWKARAWCLANKAGRVLPSPRETFKLVRYAAHKTLPRDLALDCVVFHGNEAIKEKVLLNCPLPTGWR